MALFRCGNGSGGIQTSFTPYDTGVTGFDITCKIGDIVGISFARVNGTTSFQWNGGSASVSSDYIASFGLASGCATYYYKASRTSNRFQTSDNVATIKGGVAIFSVG